MSARFLAKAALLAVSSGLALLLGEALARVALDPVDFLQPELLYDSEHGHRIAPGSGGHDALGFRNPTVPERTEVLAVGDSQTYGVAARAMESWPAWLARLTGRSVYNAGVGAYGPVDYVKVAERLVGRLKPETLVVGLYVGNDVADAAQHCPNYGPELRSVADCAVPSRELFESLVASQRYYSEQRFLGGFRNALAGHSVLYQAGKLRMGTLLSGVRELEVRTDVTTVRDDEFLMGFELGYWSAAMDPEDPGVRDGMGVVAASLRDLERLCTRHGIRCSLLLIPTKETVYADAAPPLLPATELGAYRQVVAFEAVLREHVTNLMRDSPLLLVDGLPALRAALDEDRDIYPAFDPHPNGRGYAAIARAVARELALTTAAD